MTRAPCCTGPGTDAGSCSAWSTECSRTCASRASSSQDLVRQRAWVLLAERQGGPSQLARLRRLRSRTTARLSLAASTVRRRSSKELARRRAWVLRAEHQGGPVQLSRLRHARSWATTWPSLVLWTMVRSSSKERGGGVFGFCEQNVKVGLFNYQGCGCWRRGLGRWLV